MAAQPATLPFWRTRRGQDRLVSLAIFAVLCLGAAVILLPFLWMLSTALKPAEQVYLSPPVWVPIPPQFVNFWTAFTRVPFPLYALNTAMIVGW